MPEDIARNSSWPVTDENGDYIFRLSLTPEGTEPPPNAFAELVRSQLDEMLKLIVLTYHGEAVRVDGFHFIHEPDSIRGIWS